MVLGQPSPASAAVPDVEGRKGLHAGQDRRTKWEEPDADPWRCGPNSEARGVDSFPMLHGLRERPEWKFFAILPRADRGLAFGLVGRPPPARLAGGRARGRHGRAGGSGAARASPGRAARRGRRGLRAPAGAGPHPPGDQRQPGQPGVGLAPRPAHRGLRAAAGPRPPRGSQAHQRPHGGPRVRPRDDRPAHAHQHGLHRGGDGPDRHGARLRGHPLRLRLVGAHRARRRLARHPLAAARERGLARPQHGGGPRRAAPRRIRLPARRRPARGQGAAALRPRRLGDGALRLVAARGCTSCSTR